MSKETTRPNADVSNDFPVTGAASAHAALSDDDDTSSISVSAGDPDRTVRLGFAEPTIPAGAVVKQDVIRLQVMSIPAGALRLTSIEAFPDGSTSAGKRTNLDVTWTSETTVVALAASNDIDHDQLELVLKAHCFGEGIFIGGFIFEAYWQTVYVEQPTVDSVSVSPASPINDDDTPTISFTVTLDGDGGDQAFYQVRTFTDAVYSGGGFDPATSVAADASGLLAGAGKRYTIATRLDDDTYRSYVRVGQLVNGDVLWSDWEHVQFVLAVDRPADPTINSVSADSDNARIEIHLGITPGGVVSTDAFQIERSLDGGTTWEIIRVVGNLLGLVEPGDIAEDYEVPNSQAVRYRVRSFHNFPSGTTSSSDWVESDPVFWASEHEWLKSADRPDLNLPVRLLDYPTVGRPARESRVQPLGSSTTVVVKDGPRSSPQSDLVLRVDTDDDLTVLNELLDTNGALLLQVPPGQLWPDRWVSFGDDTEERLMPKKPSEKLTKTLSWVEVPSPSSEMAVWE